MTDPIAHIDFETRSILDLKEVGLWNYSHHPLTSPWCMAAALGEEMEPELLTFADMLTPVGRLFDHVRAGGTVMAHNAPFELAIWNEICVPRYGWPRLAPEQTICTMAQAYAMGLPGALEDVALALGLAVLKDTEGRSLMLRMSRPRRMIGDRPVWWDEPEKLARLYAYCQQDVRVEREAHKRLLPLSEKERRVWLLDYRINQRGVQLDMPTVHAAIKMAAFLKEDYDRRIKELTKGEVESCNALIPLKQWLTREAGFTINLLAKQDVIDLLADKRGLPPRVTEALTLRQEAGKASTAKFDKMAAMAGSDGRLRNMYQYHGAATGRWAGRAVQTHNLIRDMPPPDTVEKILALVRANDHVAIDMIYGSPLTAISRCIRSFFVAPHGKLLISGDFANVEGRGQAWFAGEDWKIKAFVAADNKTGAGIYELAYASMFGVPVESVKDPSEERQIGKVSELAFGYQGGVGSFRTMAKAYPTMRVQEMSDTKIDGFKEAWRNAHPAIAGKLVLNTQTQRWYRRGGIWKAIENAAIAAVQSPGEVYTCGHPARQAKYRKVGSFLWCLLPSGRAICYPYPKILEGSFGPMLTYMTMPGPDKTDIIADPKNGHNWARVSTYGGSLFNNIVQGFCRDMLVDAMLDMDSKGAQIVLHTHDDGNNETNDDAGAESRRMLMEQIMRTVPVWAAGFPLYAKCKLMARYGK